jgi:CubicO group peptidase (beta-lactamase class C family)
MDMPTTPEKNGCSSRSIVRMIEKLEEANANLHSYIVMRHNQILSEGYWKPFHANRQHRIYSSGKTVVALGIGLLSDEGKISLKDRVIDYFPDKIPEKPHSHIASMTIRDLLMMATPFPEDIYTYGCEDRLHAFFHDEPKYPPGTVFNYNTSATYALGAIIERVTRKSLLDYMRPDFLKPIGVSSDIRCLTLPDGYSHAGSGIICTQRDFARLALLVQNKGIWFGRQLISKEYMQAMTSAQIDNKTSGNENTAYRGYGYGYQLWMTRNQSYTFSGMGDQMGICFPNHALTFSCMADNQGNPEARELIFKLLQSEIIDQLSDEPLPEDPDGVNLLKEKNSRLVLRPCPGSYTSPLAKSIHGTRYHLKDNPMHIKWLRLDFRGDLGDLTYENDQGIKTISFGLGSWVHGQFPQRGYPGGDYRPSDRLYACIASAGWQEEKLCLRVMIIDDFLGHLSVSFSFRGPEVHVNMHKEAQFFLDEYEGVAIGSKI